LFRSNEGRFISTFFGHPVEYWTEGYVPCIGVKIPSQVDFDLAMTFPYGKRAIKGISQNQDCNLREAMTDTKG
jgi:hypothetical protein